VKVKGLDGRWAVDEGPKGETTLKVIVAQSRNI
jgi:hypothetical protein